MIYAQGHESITHRNLLFTVLHKFEGNAVILLRVRLHFQQITFDVETQLCFVCVFVCVQLLYIPQRGLPDVELTAEIQIGKQVVRKLELLPVLLV